MRKITLLFVALQCSSFVFAQSKAERLDSLFTSLHSKNAFHGNVLIAENGKTIFEKSYGVGNIEENIKLSQKSIFNLASISKQFTASAILLLEKSKKLRLSDDITNYIPELSFYKGITIEHLVHHTSGLPDYMELFREKMNKNGTITNDDVIELFAKEQPKILFEPNEKFKYSNTGYLFLATIIERVSKTSYANYLKKHIFKPLKMNNTAVLFLYKDKLKVPNLAVGYMPNDEGNLERDVEYAQYFDGVYGQGRVYSTTEDLLKWTKALQNNTLFTKQQSDKLFADYTLNNNQNTEYGFGLFLEESEKYGKIINHSGSWGGYITYLEQQLTNDKTIVLLQNQTLITTKIPVKAVRSILYNEPLKSEKPISLQSEDLDKYLGTYFNDKINLEITITKKGNVLYSQATKQPEIPLEAYENHTFKFEPADIKLIFNPDENVFEFRQGTMGFIFKKVEE
ncbi:serine hydrolase [Capnocytophaga canis]|uniref:Serine hydrolase n=1 Tax=Capnocytophaga canis TaxID=1848903 RepID=A0A0B7I1T4_9FLAO|nr:serine hydrolase [Capnocytophaga canis]CEN45946.1 conserved exported hypothetical protein [Capnocytophaga canis]